MVSLERKFDVLHHSIASFTRWLDGCTPLLERLSASQASLESVREGREGGGEGERREGGRENEEEEAQLRDLALQYKVRHAQYHDNGGLGRLSDHPHVLACIYVLYRSALAIQIECVNRLCLLSTCMSP